MRRVRTARLASNAVLQLLVAALVARLTFVAELPWRLPAAAALVARLTFVAELPWGLVGKSRTGSGQREEDGTPVGHRLRSSPASTTPSTSPRVGGRQKRTRLLAGIVFHLVL